MSYTKFQLADRAMWVGLYGEAVSKSKAARIMGVTRSTIYNMVEDGRIAVYGNGSVSVRSLWAYVMFGQGYKGRQADRTERVGRLLHEA